MSIKILNYLPWILLGLVFISQAVDLMHTEITPTLAPATTFNQPSDDAMMLLWTQFIEIVDKILKRTETASSEDMKRMQTDLLKSLRTLKTRRPSICLFPSKIKSFVPEGCTKWDDEKYTHLLLINVGRIMKTLPETNIRLLRSALSTIDGVLKRINNRAEIVDSIMNAFGEILFAVHADDGRNLQLINYLIKSCKHRDAILEVAMLIVNKKPSLTARKLCSKYLCLNGIPMMVNALIQSISETNPLNFHRDTLIKTLFNARELAPIEGLHEGSYYSAAAAFSTNVSLEMKILVLFEFFKTNGPTMFPDEIREIILPKFAADGGQCKLLTVGEIGQLMDDDSIMTFVVFILLMKRLVHIFQDDQVIQCLIENKVMELFGIDNLPFFKCAMNDWSVYSIFMISLLKLEPTEHGLFEMVRTPIFPPGLKRRRSSKPLVVREFTSLSTTISDTRRRSLPLAWWEPSTPSYRNGGLPSTISGLPLSDEPDPIRRSCLPDLLPPSVTESSLLKKRRSRDSLRKIKNLTVPMPISRRRSTGKRSLSTNTPPSSSPPSSSPSSSPLSSSPLSLSPLSSSPLSSSPTGKEMKFRKNSVTSISESTRKNYFLLKQSWESSIKPRLLKYFRRNSSSDLQKFQEEEESTHDPRDRDRTNTI